MRLLLLILALLLFVLSGFGIGAQYHLLNFGLAIWVLYEILVARGIPK